MMKQIMRMAAVLALAVVVSGCGSVSYQDGTYTAQSSPDEDGDYGVVNLTITNGVVSDCEFLTYEWNGTFKGEEYGMEGGVIANQDYYNKAQNAVAAVKQYAKQYAETGDLKQVDAVSGATISYNQFLEAVDIALDAAKE